METENNQERKVLISVKVSTLFIILISIIILAAGAVAVGNYITAQEMKEKNLSENNTEEQEKQKSAEEETVSSEVPTIQISERNSVISSRSSGRRETVAISVVENPEEENVEEEQENLVVVSTPIEEVKISIDMDLTVRTGLSKEDFIKLISEVNEDTSGFFKENASYIYDMCEKYSLNEIFFCGLISAESGWSIAQNHRNTHNYISLMSANGLIKFNSVEEGLEKAAQTLHDKYLTPGGCFYYGSTLAAMKTRFCPASPTWVNLVYGRMEQIMK